MVTLETLTASYYADGNIRLLGFDSACRDDMRAALRLLGEYSPLSVGGLTGAYEYEGVLVLEVRPHFGASRGTEWLRQTYLLRVDPNDGYRSSLAPVICSPIDNLILQFEHAPIPVKVVESKRRPNTEHQHDDNTSIVDLYDGHVWLAFGTSYAVDYYPTAYVDWQPKAPKDGL